MIGITIETHTTKAIANEAVAGGSTGPPPDLSSVVVVPDEATPLWGLCFDVPGLTGGESAMLSVWARAQVLWRQQGRVAAQRLGGGAEVGLAAHMGGRVRGATVCRMSSARWRKDRLPARKDRLQGALLLGCCREKRVNCRGRKITIHQ